MIRHFLASDLRGSLTYPLPLPTPRSTLVLTLSVIHVKNEIHVNMINANNVTSNATSHWLIAMHLLIALTTLYRDALYYHDLDLGSARGGLRRS